MQISFTQSCWYQRHTAHQEGVLVGTRGLKYQANIEGVHSAVDPMENKKKTKEKVKKNQKVK